jgi:hypothetical protein
MVTTQATSSSLMLEEWFEAGDLRFYDELLASTAEKKLKSLGERWARDQRSFARRMLLRYIDEGCDRPNQRALVKKLFKTAEEKGDDEAMAHFLVAFDRLLKRRLVARDRYDWSVREVVREQVLVEEAAVPRRAQVSKGSGHPSGRFTRATRRYLKRRALRYFRRLGYRDIDRYGRAIRAALMLYEDQHLEKPEHLLDAWGLVHALYWGSPVLVRDPGGVRLASGRSLADLEPAPMHPKAWEHCFEELLHMLEKARSRPVRLFAKHLLEASYAEEAKHLMLGRIKRLLMSPHEEPQEYAAERLKHLPGLEKLSIDEWLELLEVNHPAAIAMIVEYVKKHVAPSRLDLAAAVKLGLSSAAPVAELGLAWAKEKPIARPQDLAEIMKLAAAPCPRVRQDALAHLVALIASSPLAADEHVRELCDSRFEDARKAGLDAMLRIDRHRDSTLLWGSLAESPYDDVKEFFVAHLEAREKHLAPESLLGVWASSLLSVHRGGRAKRTVLSRVTERVIGRAAEAPGLVPLLAVSLRSVRAPERRGALAALARAAFRAPELAKEIAARIPELELFPKEK